jgi:hypothetical protein
MALIKPTTTATKLIFEYQVASFPRKRESSQTKKALRNAETKPKAFLIKALDSRFRGNDESTSIQLES